MAMLRSIVRVSLLKFIFPHAISPIMFESCVGVLVQWSSSFGIFQFYWPCGEHIVLHMYYATS